MREIISMEIEQGVTIKLGDGTTIIGGKQIDGSYESKEENEILHESIM